MVNEHAHLSFTFITARSTFSLNFFCNVFFLLIFKKIMARIFVLVPLAAAFSICQHRLCYIKSSKHAPCFVSNAIVGI